MSLNVKVPMYYGKNPQLQGHAQLQTKEGVLVKTNDRKITPDLLPNMLEELHNRGFSFETVGTGLKIGKMSDGRLDSRVVVHNVSDKGFGLYVLKRPPEKLPARDGFETEGEPISGANRKSSRAFVPFEGNDNSEKALADWIDQLPGVFENGRKTTFNSDRSAPKPKPEKKDKPKRKSKKEKAEKSKAAEESAEIIEMPEPTSDTPPENNGELVETFTVGRRKRTAANG